MRNVSISKSRKFIELFGVRLNEDINKQPVSHGSDYISFRLTEEQHKQLREGLSRWKTWDMLDISNHWDLWEVGNSRQVIGLSSRFRKHYEVYLKNISQVGQLVFS